MYKKTTFSSVYKLSTGFSSFMKCALMMILTISSIIASLFVNPNMQDFPNVYCSICSTLEASGKYPSS